MEIIDRTCQCDCGGRAIVSGAIIGIVATFLRYNATITVTSAFLWGVFGIAVVYLGIALLYARSVNIDQSPCVCRTLSYFMTGILGTILTSVVLLDISFGATSIIGAIITGALFFFFTFLLISAVCFIKCRYSCN